MKVIKQITNKIVIVDGNLLNLADEGYFDAIIHGCNCQNKMGAGIAKQIKNRYPEAYFADEQYNKFSNAKSSMLGCYSYCTVKTINEDLRSRFFIINAYTQLLIGANFNIEAFKQVMLRIDYMFTGMSIGLPWIGCGIGGLKDKSKILDILKSCKNNNYYIIEYDGIS